MMYEFIIKNAIDQLAHIVSSFLIFSLLFYFIIKSKPFLGFLLSGLLFGLIRELTEEGSISLNSTYNIFSSLNSVIDLIGWSVGGIIFYYAFYKRKINYKCDIL